ncbi:MAG: PH domain-containing protein [Comamonadaceae bacterium]|nr:PH domain-containing protein [Comamonadaceae bacterium]
MGSAVLVLVSLATAWPRIASLPGQLVLGATLVLGAGLPIWLLVSTVYRVDEAELKIQSGPLRWKIPLQSIRAVEPSRSWWSSPALSLDRLCIHHGRMSQTLVSPRQKLEFIQALKQRNARIQVQGF